jgi:hypothetical protein
LPRMRTRAPDVTLRPPTPPGATRRVSRRRARSCSRTPVPNRSSSCRTNRCLRNRAPRARTLFYHALSYVSIRHESSLEYRSTRAPAPSLARDRTRSRDARGPDDREPAAGVVREIKNVNVFFLRKRRNDQLPQICRMLHADDAGDVWVDRRMVSAPAAWEVSFSHS